MKPYRFGLLVITISVLTACVPCREVLITSRPPGARIYLPAPDSYNPSLGPETRLWNQIGRAPLQESSCSLKGDLKAVYRGRELFLPKYPGEGEVEFDFTANRVNLR